jgi:hypothetical protein
MTGAGGKSLPGPNAREEEPDMLWTIVVVLFVLWLLGFFAFHVGGGLIHALLVIAVIVVLYRVITGRRAV